MVASADIGNESAIAANRLWNTTIIRKGVKINETMQRKGSLQVSWVTLAMALTWTVTVSPLTLRLTVTDCLLGMEM